MRIEYLDIEASESQVYENNVAITSSVIVPYDWFRIRLWFRSNTFMEIKQIKAYNFENLVGNAGGYVGLFLGYSVIQLPYFATVIYQKIK